MLTHREQPRIAAVIGDPVKHSLSPRLFRYWLDNAGIVGTYAMFHVKQDELGDSLHHFRKLGFAGLNVTLPLKERILSLADEVTEEAHSIGAANTVTFLEDGRIQADNTDAYGFIQNLKLSASDWYADQGPALVLGAGGASRAVVYALIKAGCPKVMLANRNVSRAESVSIEIGGPIEPLELTQIGTVLHQVRTIINTTSLGMVGHPPLELSFDQIDPSVVVNDIVYRPLETPLLRDAKKRGCIAVDGLGMLLHQAVPGFERWFGHTPCVDNATRAHMLSLL